jgi:hypothetical protein
VNSGSQTAVDGLHLPPAGKLCCVFIVRAHLRGKFMGAPYTHVRIYFICFRKTLFDYLTIRLYCARSFAAHIKGWNAKASTIDRSPLTAENTQAVLMDITPSQSLASK